MDRLTYLLNEVLGCGEEFLATPCKSLQQRLQQAIANAIRFIDQGD